MEQNPLESNLAEKLAKIRRKKAEKRSFMSDWPLEKYIEVLDIDPSEMKGCLVLDLGAGETERFSKDAAKEGIKVVSLSPLLLKKTEITDEFRENWQRRSVPGRGQQLPYRDESFDYIVALYSVPFYLPLFEEEYNEFFKEIIRTLKPGGKAYLCPVFQNNNAEEKEGKRISGELITDALDKFPGITYTIEKVPAEREDFRLVITKNRS